jgi:ABC-type sugar transport system ATPase subunit
VSAGAKINARVVAVERLGDRTDIAMEVAGESAMNGGQTRLVARVNADEAEHMREGDEVRVLVDTAHVHLFEPGECGARITAS